METQRPHASVSLGESEAMPSARLMAGAAVFIDPSEKP